MMAVGFLFFLVGERVRGCYTVKELQGCGYYFFFFVIDIYLL